MGDSFLKYSTTLFLYGRFTGYGEGRLTELRGKLVSNEHLRPLGDSKGLGEILSASIFYPEFNFLPPSYRVIESYAQAGMKADVAITVFHNLDGDTLKVTRILFNLFMNICYRCSRFKIRR
jgi:hypothetical protein